MQWKKVAASLVASAVVLVGLTACGGSDGKAATKKTKDGSTILSLWTFVDLHGEFYEAMAKKWNAQHPDEKVKLDVNVMPYDDMHNKLQLGLNSGKGLPDIVDIELSRYAGFMVGKPALVDLTEAAAPYAQDIVKSQLDEYSKDGHLYGLTTHVGTTLAFYNNELLKAAGIDYTTIKTWDDFKAAGVAYRKKTGKAFGTADSTAMWQEGLLMGQFGGEFVKDGKVQVDSPEFVKSLSLLKDLQDAGAISTIPGGQPDTEEAYGEIAKGSYAAFIMPAWFMSRFVDYMPDLAGKIVIAPAPVDPGAKWATVGGGGTGTAVPSAGANTQLAADFISYAKLSKDGNIGIWETLGFDPVNKSLWTDKAVTHNPENKFNKYFQNNLFDVLNPLGETIGNLSSFSDPAFPSVNNTMITETLNAIFEKGADIEDTLEQAQSDLENELGQ